MIMTNSLASLNQRLRWERDDAFTNNSSTENAMGVHRPGTGQRSKVPTSGQQEGTTPDPTFGALAVQCHVGMNTEQPRCREEERTPATTRHSAWKLQETAKGLVSILFSLQTAHLSVKSSSGGGFSNTLFIFKKKLQVTYGGLQFMQSGNK